LETEVYDCGCHLRYRKVDHGEFEGDLPQTILIPSFVPCDKHKGNSVVPPPDARLVTVMREPENFLNE
jgi:hypothetical protein